MRQNVKMIFKADKDEAKEKAIYIYSHWDGDEGDSPLMKKVRNAIARRQRWDDASYLGRIIFSEIIKDDIGGERGYGLSTEQTDPNYADIVIDMERQTVDDVGFEDFIKE